MLSINIDAVNGIAIFEPRAALSETDFEQAKKIIDPYIEANGSLNGLIIYSQSFPGWNSFAALSGHLEFVKEHHKKIAHIALVTDSVLGHIAESIAGHFVNAEIKSFPYADIDQAKAWIAEADK